MNYRILSFFLSIMILASLHAQTQFRIKGRTVDSSGNPVKSVTVRWKTLSGDSLQTLTDSAGHFSLLRPGHSAFGIVFTSIGFLDCEVHQEISGSPVIDMGTIVMKYHFEKMQEVIFVKPVAAITIKEDTIDYKADSFAVRKDGDVEDLLKKLPGIRVRKDGNIIAQGKMVTRIKVNGKDFFDGDIQTATRNIPASIVDKVQVINDYGDASNFTGIKGSEPEKIINIQLKKDKEQGYFVKLTDGYGTGQVYEGINSANYFDKDRQISVFTNNNNVLAPSLISGISKPFFGSLSNLMQLNNSAIQQLGGNRSAGSLITNQDFGYLSTIPNYSNGVNTNSVYGARYSDDINKKTKVYFSYIKYNIDNKLQYDAQGLQFVTGDTAIDQHIRSNKETFSKGQRIFANIEYNPDSLFSIKLTPNFTFQNIRNTETSVNINSYETYPLNLTYTENAIKSDNDQVGVGLLLRKRFKGSGSKLLLETNYTDGHVKNAVKNYNIFTASQSDTSNQTQSTVVDTKSMQNRLSYMVSFSRRHLFEFYYNYNLSLSVSSRNTYWFSPPADTPVKASAFSGNINSSIYSNVLGVNYKLFQRKMEYTLGYGMEKTSYSRNETFGTLSIHAGTFNILPLVQVARKISNNELMNFKYSGSVRQPNPLLLIPIPDSTNSLIVYKGNISLKPEFANSLNWYYFKFDFTTGRLILAGLTYAKVINKIVPTITVDAVGKTTVSYINSKYGSDVGFYYNYSRPFENRKFEISLGGNFLNSNYVFFNTRNTIINSFKFNNSFEFKMIRDFGEMALGMSVNQADILLGSSHYQTVDYSFNQKSDVDLGSVRVGYNLTMIRPHGYLYNNASRPVYLLDGYFEKKITRKLSARIEGNDLLNQSYLNNNRLNTDNYVTDYRFNAIGRYVLFLMIFKLNHFSAAGH